MGLYGMLSGCGEFASQHHAIFTAEKIMLLASECNASISYNLHTVTYLRGWDNLPCFPSTLRKYLQATLD